MFLQERFRFNFYLYKKILMFEIHFALMRGFGLCINYTNEDLEGVPVIADDMRHTIQLILFIFLININYYTNDTHEQTD